VCKSAHAVLLLVLLPLLLLGGLADVATAIDMCGTPAGQQAAFEEYRYFWAEAGLETVAQGQVTPSVDASCGHTVPCSGQGMYPGGTAHAGGWVAAVDVDGQPTSAFFVFGGEGVATDGLENVVMNNLWAFTNGTWCVAGGGRECLRAAAPLCR
jgi:hypothetical protein